MSVEFKIPQSEFVDALADAAIAAGTDLTLPVLCAVHLAGDKGAESVTLTGTDRFIMVQRVLQLPEPLANKIDALIPLDQVKVLTSVLKSSAALRRTEPAITVATSEDKLSAGNVTVALDQDHQYVKYGSLLDQGASADAEISLLPIDLKLLARVGKLTAAKPRGTYASIYFTRGKNGQPGMLSVRFENDESTRVLVMPARIR